MTPKQAERIAAKIKKIKAALADDKKRWGGYYHDGRGLRYAPPQLYIQIGDFTGGLRYVNWFKKNFPDDACYPEFFWEWACILFMTGRVKEADTKAFQSFCDTVRFMHFYGGSAELQTGATQDAHPEIKSFAKSCLDYLHAEPGLANMVEWFQQFIQSEKFAVQSTKVIEIFRKLNEEQAPKKRDLLLKQAQLLEEDF